MSNKWPFFKIETGFYVLGVCSLIIVAIIAWVAVNTVEDQVTSSLQADYQRQEESVASQTADNLKLQVSTLTEKLKYIAEQPEIQSLDTNTCNAKVDRLVTEIGSSVSNLGRVNPSGVFYCSHNRQLVGVPASKLGSYVDEIIKDPEHQPRMSQMIKPAGSDSYLLAVHVPVYDKSGKFVGTLGGAISTKQLSEILSKIKVGNQGTVSVIDSNGDIIYTPSPQFIGRNRYDADVKKIRGSAPGLDAAFARAAKSGATSRLNYTANKQQRFSVITGFQVMPGRYWVINSNDTVADILAINQKLGINNYIAKLSAIYGFVFIFVMAAAVIFLRVRVFKPLQQFSAVERSIEGGKFDERMPVRTNDELGALAKTFNQVLDRLAQRRVDLEQEVEAKTQQLAGQVKQFEEQNRSLHETKQAMLNILEDLSEEKAAAEQGRLRDEALLSSIGEGLIVIDDKGNISSMNPAGLATLGYSSDEVVGKWFPGFIEAANAEGKKVDPLNRPITRALTTGQVVTEVVYYKKKNGTTFPAAITVSPVVVEGIPVGAIEVFRDITKERQLEEAKEEFVSLASHQLRTPATGVKAFVSMLIDGYAGKMTDKQMTFVQKIYDTNERQLQIVTDMLNVARIDAGRINPEFMETDVNGLVKDIVDEQSLTIKERKQKVDVKLPTPAVKAVLDPKLIRMVVDNLLSNASKYTADGGLITVTLATDKTDGLLLSVKDSGVGISKEDLPKLFKRFSRIDNKLSTIRGGTGLGLYLAQNIVLLHHGRMMVDSELGKGTTFTVHLPLKQAVPKKATVVKKVTLATKP